MAEQLVSVLIVLLCFLVLFAILYAAFYLAKQVVEKQHRVQVLEDSYKEATEHIGNLEREIVGLNSQIEQMQYESQLNGQRIPAPRGWDPRNPLESSDRR